MSKDDWRDVPGRPFRVNSDGGVMRIKTGNVLSPSRRPDGYLCVGVRDGAKTKTFLVHRLVLEAFDPRQDSGGMEGNHLNLIKHDNRLENLEWCSHQENSKHAADNGVMPHGEGAGWSKLNGKKVRAIRELSRMGGISQKKLASYYGVSQMAISLVVQRKNWKHI